jgi:hypothetical protein
MSKYEVPINYEFKLLDQGKTHKYTINVMGDTFAEIKDNANKLRAELFELYSKDNGIKITDKVTFESGEEISR